MPIDKEIMAGFRIHTQNLINVKSFLEGLYHSETFSNTFNKPVIRLLISAVDYLEVNLGLLKQRHITSNT